MPKSHAQLHTLRVKNIDYSIKNKTQHLPLRCSVPLALQNGMQECIVKQKTGSKSKMKNILINAYVSIATRDDHEDTTYENIYVEICYNVATTATSEGSTKAKCIRMIRNVQMVKNHLSRKQAMWRLINDAVFTGPNTLMNVSSIVEIKINLTCNNNCTSCYTQESLGNVL